MILFVHFLRALRVLRGLFSLRLELRLPAGSSHFLSEKADLRRILAEIVALPAGCS